MFEKKSPSQLKLNKIRDLLISNNPADAEKKVKELLLEFSNSSTLLNMLGVSLISQKKYEEAKKIYLILLKNNPEYAEAFNNLGNIYMNTKDNDKAIYNFEKALSKNPNLKQAKFNLARIYTEIGNDFLLLNKIKLAIKNYKKAIEINHDFIDAYNNLGICLSKIDDFDEAKKNFLRALKIDPGFEEANNNLAVTYINEGSFEEAMNIYNKIYEKNPKEKKYLINSKLVLPSIPENTESINSWRKKYILSIPELGKNKYVIGEPQNVINPPTFNLAYNDLKNIEIVKKVSDMFRKTIPIINYKKSQKNKSNSKIRIGFISEFFTNHTIGKLYRGLIKMINKKDFEVIVFHFPKTKDGKIKNEIDSYADKIIKLENKLINQQNQISSESIDILFYPDIGMTSSSYFLAHARLASVQVVSWGHPETTGIDTIDYFLSSEIIEKTNSQQFYSEKLISLKNLPMYFMKTSTLDIKYNREYFGIDKNKNIYCCPQSLFKIHPDFDKTLSRIVKEDNNSQIVMIETNFKNHVEKIKLRWSKNNPELLKKVIFFKNLDFDNFISLINSSDVLLDPFYFGSGMSFTESMFVGTPTITMPATFMRSRIVAGAYKQMKISNPPVALNSEDYVNIALELASNKKKNIELKQNLRTSADKFLFNDLNFINEVQKFFIQSLSKTKS